MSMLSREKFRSAGVGLAMLAGVFFASSSGAQQNNPDTPEHDEAPIRMTLPNLTTHPLAGGTVMQRLCAEDGMGERSCENVEVFIAPPALENPIGKILHGLRRDLAVDDLNAAPGVIVSIQDILDTQAENFANPESLTRLSEIQQDLESGVETQDLSVLDKAVQDLWRLILQLEDDMRSEAEKALEDALEALKDALEKGASEEELKELREQAEEAMENFLDEQLENAEANEIPVLEKKKGYDGIVTFVSDGRIQTHLAQRDLNIIFRTGHTINPLERGHVAYRTDDLDAFKTHLEENGIPYSDWGETAVAGWQQIFFYDPDGNIIEVHQVTT